MFTLTIIKIQRIQ